MRSSTETATKTYYICLALGLAAISSANVLHDIPKHNPLGIDWDPAPSPENGPPLSAGANRDTSHLPIEISGIVGAYLGCVCIIAIGLLVVGRNNRRKLALANKARDIEMTEPRMHPIITSLPASPAFKSPSRNFSRPSWPAQEKNGPTPYVFPGTANSPRSPTSPYSPQTPHSVEHPTVDTRIVERDQHMLQRDLEDIYAHVMAQEDAKASGVPVKALPLPPQLQAAGPVPPTPPQSTPSPQKKIEKRRPSNIDVVESSKGHSKSASKSSSIISALMSPKRNRKMRISSPMASPAISSRWQGKANEDENEPLTPRYYATLPPPPPVPTDQEPYVHSRKTSNDSPVSPTRSIAQQLESHSQGNSSAYHRPNPSQGSFGSLGALRESGWEREREPDPISATSATSTTPFNPVPIPGSSANNTSGRLPFRQFEPALTSPSYSSFAQSTKTTILERTNGPRGPNTGGLQTPWSAGAVPYSPYQPFTPMIPITPRLVTKEERKMKEKMEKKARGNKVPELVQSSDDMWDSGY